MPLLEVTFADDHVFFPAAHLSRLGGTFDGTLAVAGIRDADPGTTPPEIRTLTGEILFVPATQRADLERFCQARQIPVRKRPDIWGDLLQPYLFEPMWGTPNKPQLEAARSRLRQAGLTSAEIGQIRARVGPLMTAFNFIHWDQYHLGLADLLDAATTARVPVHLRSELGEITSFYSWAMATANRSGQ